MKNVLIIHDISCYGKCSTTVALPIISSMELAGTILPTSLLSTHTGPEFENFTFLDLTDEMPKIVDHWKAYDLRFEAIYIGYLGSIKQIKFLEKEIPNLLKEGGQVILDPVMADGGNFYYGFDQAYADEMRQLAKLADVLLPNYTEAAKMYQLDYKDGKWNQADIDQVRDLVAEETPASLVLTGAGFDGEKTGAFYYDVKDQSQGLIQADYIGGAYHGTGDIFGSILTGALVNGSSLVEAVQLAVESVPKVIERSIALENTMQEGLAFEEILGDLSQYVRDLKN
ncbi:pyridoxal kinase [Aerococcus urinaehominis]|uniref:pyridoxal kinase n=1 Tax=Aerococcus urinaehominis TaxID=128944 RepID=A0A0X8FKI2_9LACT|nr:pyridoxamine kinase [Aerococcus urinaehominis]AMB98907.1 pyridoxal kinase [Aerococcus urinaehominis]SDM61137.1 pyridoxine kinase [Aerococcus urinaehominis]